MASRIATATTAVALVLAFSMNAHSQPCAPNDFTIQDVEKYDLSDTIKYSGYSLLTQKSDEDRHKAFSGSAVIYDVPVSLSYDDSSRLSQFMLEKSGFTYNRDTRVSFVRTALSAVGAEMYKDCIGAEVIKTIIPHVAYSSDSFVLTVGWNPREGQFPSKVRSSITTVGGTIRGKQAMSPDFERGVDQQFLIHKDAGLLAAKKELQIYITINGSSYPPIVIPPAVEIKKVAIKKVYGSYSPARHGPGNDCDQSAELVAELGSAAGPDTKVCRLCVDKPANGILLMDTAQTEGQTIDAAKIDKEKPNSDLQVCALFTAIGRGQNGPRTEVRGGRLYVFEAVSE